MSKKHNGGKINRRDLTKAAGMVALTSLVGIKTAMAANNELSPLTSILPKLSANDAACDCHVHVFDPARFPYTPKRSYTPGNATVADLRAFHAKLGIKRAVVVQPSVYGSDNRCLVDALTQLGPQVARGVAVIQPQEISDDELKGLHAAGVRAVRVNLEVKGEKSPAVARKALQDAANRVAPLKWGLQVYADLSVIAGIADTIAQLPAPIVLDHFAGAHAQLGTAQPGFDAVLNLVKSGKAWVKLSGVYRASKSAPDYADVRPLAQALIEANASQLVWASDWPHTGSSGSRSKNLDVIEPFRQIDDRHVLGLLATWTDDPAVQRRILVDNPARFFGF